MNVHQRFLAVQAAMAAHGISKSGVNQQQRYNYRGIEQVQNALAPLLAEHQLIIMPNTLNHSMTQGTTKNGGVMYHHTVEVEYTIFGPEGDSIGPFKSRGECIDTADKGLNKAHTAAYKYWVLTAMCVPTEATEDADATTPEPSEPVITPEQFNELNGLMGQLDPERQQRFVEWISKAGCTKLSELYASNFEAVKARLESMYSDQYAQEQQDTARSMGQ